MRALANDLSFDLFGSRPFADVIDPVARSSQNHSRALSRTITSAQWLANLVIAGFALQSVLFLAIGFALLMVAPPHPPAVIAPVDGE
jgi:hypothetical protein